MARMRVVHPGLLTDENFVDCSFPARMLAIALWIHADCQGVFEWKIRTIKMKCLPADNVDVEVLLDELLKNRQICKYEAGGRHYGAIRNFQVFQKPKNPTFTHPVTVEALIWLGMSEVDIEKLLTETENEGDPPKSAKNKPKIVNNSRTKVGNKPGLAVFAGGGMGENYPSNGVTVPPKDSVLGLGLGITRKTSPIGDSSISPIDGVDGVNDGRDSGTPPADDPAREDTEPEPAPTTPGDPERDDEGDPPDDGGAAGGSAHDGDGFQLTPPDDPVAAKPSSGGRSSPESRLLEACFDDWREITGDLLVKPRSFDTDRRKALKLRLADFFENDREQWRRFCQRVVDSPHLRGENERGWRADFDWVLKPRNTRKIVEGGYVWRPLGTKPEGGGNEQRTGSGASGTAGVARNATSFAARIVTATRRVGEQRRGAGQDGRPDRV